MNFLQDKIFLDRKNKNNHYFFGDVSLPSLTWETVIKCFNYNIVNNLYVKPLQNYGIVLHDYSNIEIIDNILKSFLRLDPTKTPSAHLYISFTEKSDTFGRHKDVSDVLYWQGIGATKWIVEDEDRQYEYILNPNDLIYIPKGLYHNVIPLSPRVGISFGLD